MIYYTEDTTLKARWKSGHVLESTVPDGAVKVVGSEFWTYDVTTNISSDQAFVDGYTLYDTISEWGEYGDWSEWSVTEVTASETREVETRSVWGYFSYTCTNCGYHNDAPYTQCVCGYYTEHSDFESIWSTQAWTGYYKHTIDEETWYEWTHENNGAERIQYRYRERELIYTYYHTKTETLESTTEVTESDTISNINKYVQYVIQ